MWVKFWLAELSLWNILKLHTPKGEGFDLPAAFGVAQQEMKIILPSSFSIITWLGRRKTET